MTTQQPLNPGNSTIAVYVRSAAPTQITRQAPCMQTRDLIALARQLGWTDEHIIVFDQDIGTSGSLPLDQKPGLQALVKAITQDQLQAVLVANETRLFRNATGVEVHTFIRLCQEHNVKVITPEITYDFSHPMFARRFRFLTEQGSTAIYQRTASGKGNKGKQKEDSYPVLTLPVEHTN